MYNPFLNVAQFDIPMVIVILLVALAVALVHHYDAVKAAEEAAAWERLWKLTSRDAECFDDDDDDDDDDDGEGED